MTERLIYERIWERKLGAAPARLPVDRWIVVASEFEPAGRLLDIGCGDGRGPETVSRLAQHIVGADIAVSACREARAHGLLAVAASLNDSHLPFAAATFDAVTCLDVVEHLLDPLH